MPSNRGSVVAVQVREQSEIFRNRRKNRRARINSVHAEVRAILQADVRSAGKVSLEDKSILRKTN